MKGSTHFIPKIVRKKPYVSIENYYNHSSLTYITLHRKQKHNNVKKID